MSDEARDVSLEQLLDLVRDIVADGIRGFEIGQVTAYDAVSQLASIQPVVMRAVLDESGARVVKPSAVVARAMVWFLGTSGRVTVPVRIGDYGLLLYSSVSLARWKQRGGVIDPLLDHRHDESDAVFVPGGHDFAHVPTPAPTDSVVIHASDGVTVRIGASTGTQKTLLADSFLSALDTCLSAIQTAVGTITSVSGGTAAAAAILTAINAFKADPLRSGYKTSKTELK